MTTMMKFSVSREDWDQLILFAKRGAYLGTADGRWIYDLNLLALSQQPSLLEITYSAGETLQDPVPPVPERPVENSRAPITSPSNEMAAVMQRSRDPMERIAAAMRYIENAQGQLDRALQVLSSLHHFDDKHVALQKLRERVHAFWYVVKNTAQKREHKIALDSLATAELRDEQTDRDERAIERRDER